MEEELNSNYQFAIKIKDFNERKEMKEMIDQCKAKTSQIMELLRNNDGRRIGNA